MDREKSPKPSTSRGTFADDVRAGASPEETFDGGTNSLSEFQTISEEDALRIVLRKSREDFQVNVISNIFIIVRVFVVLHIFRY